MTDIDLSTIRERLSQQEGKAYWRSLDEVADTPEFRAFLEQELPQGASELASQISRRRFLVLAAASLGLAGLAACAPQPEEKIVPYVEQPEEIVPGKPLFFATADLLGGFANGVLVESHTGRPTKVEGNPDHPASLGATDIFAQASVLNIYDPDRSQVVKSGGRIRTWEEFLSVLEAAVGTQSSSEGAEFRILTETVTSPTLIDQLQTLLDQFPQTRWHQYEPVNRDNIYDGTRLAFGEPLDPIYHFENANVILALESDFLSVGPGRLRYTRDFVDRRRVREDQTDMNRLYAVEGTPSLTGAMADHRWPLRSSQVELFARSVAQKLGFDVETSDVLPAEFEPWIDALVRDLQENQGACVVTAGDGQPPAVHALAHAMNDALNNIGNTVVYTDPVAAATVNQTGSLQELVTAMQNNEVELLIILGGNPAYNAPAGVNFAQALEQVGLTAHLSLYENETSMLCDWHLPQTHYLEAWSDARAYDGTATIIQPLIEPLYTGRSAHELLAEILQSEQRSSYDIVRAFWQNQASVDDFESYWRKALHDGVLPDTALSPRTVALSDFTLLDPVPAPAEDSLEIIFRPDPGVWDGRFNNNGWLQELPKPFTKLTWDNAALVSPRTAERLQLSNEDVVTLRHQEQAVAAPVWILPGQADGCVTVHLGYGRTQTGRIGAGAGFDAYTIRSPDGAWFAAGLELEKTGDTYSLSTTQTHHSMEGRDLVRASPIQQFIENPEFAQHHEGELPSLYPDVEYDSYAWGMSIDLNACIGCNACILACQAENNIPIVGKDQVAVGREMHWMRVDGYFGGDLDDPELHHQPVTCMHCENAPCEPVCPVAATVHSSEGLNEMVYNRCVGTRYCSNNCPYKVRRFNFLEYADPEEPVLKLLNNPDVTVRSRGVMEKCTYCVQRINQARINAKKEGRPIQDGEIVTACQAACPAEAIVFGDINNEESQVAQLKAQAHNYGLLTDLNTRPRTTYLAKFKNPNPEIEASDGG